MLDVVDTETGAKMHIQTNSQGLRERYAAAVAERQDGIRRLLAGAGVDHLELSTDRDWLIDVARFLRRRRTLGSVTAAGRLSARLSHPAGGPRP
jgi:uncharacterized protein (DUF58 family)